MSTRPLEELGKDKKLAGHYRVLYAEKIRSNAFAAAARNPKGGLVHALFELLTFGVRSNEMYVVPVNVLYTMRQWKKLVKEDGGDNYGVPFFQLVSHAYLKTSAKKKNPVMVVGIRRGTGEAFVTNPASRSGGAGSGNEGLVQYGDELLAAAYRQPKMGRLRKWARMFKTFMSFVTGIRGLRR